VAHAGVAVPVLARFASARVRADVLPPMVRGEALAAVANAEPASGTDALGVRARAVPDVMHGPGWLRLSARKRSITNVGEADVVLVSARRCDAPDPRRAIAAYVLDGGSPGCHQRRRLARMGLWTSPTGDLIARRVAVAPDAFLCDGVEFFRACFALERLAVGALYAGALRRAVRRAVAFVRARPALAAHQYVQQRVVAARTSLALVEALLFEARRAYLAGEPCEAALSALKGEGAERALASAQDVVRLLGAQGYEGAAGEEKDVRDLVGLTLLGGTSELHKGVVFRAAMRGE
jgi:alkylation response protein AidB-like acyl-CoA dehydrogenase